MGWGKDDRTGMGCVTKQLMNRGGGGLWLGGVGMNSERVE